MLRSRLLPQILEGEDIEDVREPRLIVEQKQSQGR
jgi:hypothetical protein